MSEHLDTLADEALAKMAKAGKQAAFEKLYERHLSPVYNRLRALLPPEAVEDTTQEVFIAALQGIERYQEQALFRTWLAGITRHKVADFYRKRGRRPEAAPLDEEAENVADPDAWHADQAAVSLALWKLEDHYREIILLRFAEGMPFEQIAQTLGETLDAVKSRYRRAIAALQIEITDREIR